MAKTFKQAPAARKPSPDAITAFEAGGPGTDRTAAPQTHIPTKAGQGSGSTKRLSLDLPAATHQRFKTACSATGRKMVGEIEAFIEHRTAELEAEAGITRK